MMNQYGNQAYRFSGRNDRDTRMGDRAPYRRPVSRGGLPVEPYNGRSRIGGGCGCGMGQTRSNQSRNQARMGMPDRETAEARERTDPSCGCGATVAANLRSQTDTRSACGCGEQRADQGSCHKLLEQIRAVDFALYEVILYLDVYPHSCDALETYHKLKTQKEALHREYESTYGPLTAFGNESGVQWNWIDSPFPWEFSAE